MAKLVTIEKQELADFLTQTEDKTRYCKALEAGNILFFPECPFAFPQEELDFLLAQKQTGSTKRKNIAYKPEVDKITNFVKSSPEQHTLLHTIMRNYSQRATALLTDILPDYASTWKLDYASFRPFQEKGRPLRTRARNDLLHVDSFPTRPMRGNRILRFFTNINPQEGRRWMTGPPFEELAALFGGKGVAFPKDVNPHTLTSSLIKIARKVGLPLTPTSPYDTFMLKLHHFLKENTHFQETCPKDYWEFPPHSSWIVFTDQVSHAALSGQYALEQTFIISKDSLIDPDKAPIALLDKLSKKS